MFFSLIHYCYSFKTFATGRVGRSKGCNKCDTQLRAGFIYYNLDRKGAPRGLRWFPPKHSNGEVGNNQRRPSSSVILSFPLMLALHYNFSFHIIKRWYEISHIFVLLCWYHFNYRLLSVGHLSQILSILFKKEHNSWILRCSPHFITVLAPA